MSNPQPCNSIHETPSALAYPPTEQKFVSAEGLYLVADDGRRYLDGCAGTFNVNLGYGHPAVVSAVNSVLTSGLTHVSSTFANDHVSAAAKALVSIAPDSVTHCHMKGSTGGSSAIEQAMRHAWIATGRRTFVAFRGGHHGQTIATTALSGMAFRRNRIPTPSAQVTHVDPPDCYRCPFGKQPASCRLECLKPVTLALDNPSQGGEGDVAGFVAEPILGAGGGLTPPLRYWPELHSRLKARGIPLIFDEVQTFGRTGHFFAAQHYDVKPDLIVVAKGISGIGIPGVGAVLMGSRFRLLKSCERSLTWGASPMGCAAVEATIRIMNVPSFFSNVRTVSRLLAERLERIAHRFECVGTIRGTGLMKGLEIVTSRLTKAPDPKLAERIVMTAHHHGLLLRTSEYGRGAFIKIRPALVISADEVNELCDRLERSLEDVTGASA